MRNYEELEVWQKAHRLTIDVYHASNGFPRSEMFGLTSQVRRSAGSIGANLAEGCGRWSDGEMVRYTQIAMGSASELQNHLRLAVDLGYLTDSEYENLRDRLTSIRQMLAAFFQKLRGARVSTEKSGISGE